MRTSFLFEMQLIKIKQNYILKEVCIIYRILEEYLIFNRFIFSINILNIKYYSTILYIMHTLFKTPVLDMKV